MITFDCGRLHRPKLPTTTVQNRDKQGVHRGTQQEEDHVRQIIKNLFR